MSFVPLINRTHYSLARSLIHPSDFVKRCVKNGYGAAAITDYNSLSGAVDFYKCCTDKKQIKPIIGLDDGQCVYLAKNKNGWARLIQNKYNEENQDVIVLTGYDTSIVSNLIFTDSFTAFKSKNLSDIKNLIHSEYKLLVRRHLKGLIERHGKENVFVSLQLMNSNVLMAEQIQGEILRETAKEFNIDCVATPNVHYLDKESVNDLKVVFCSDLDCRLDNLYQKLVESDELKYFSNMFFDDNFHLPIEDELKKKYTIDEIENTQKVADRCEVYKLLNQPRLPRFDPTIESKELLLQNCRIGWCKRFGKNFKKQEYVDRIKSELNVVSDVNVLCDYFLIVQDFINFAKQNNIMVGLGRGSGAGSLINYLLEITNMEPIEHNLLFERFFNYGRLSKDNVSLPDIDTDFEINRRGEIVEYIRNKYGHDKVAQIATFSRMQGRGALTDVLRAHNVCTHEQIKIITKPFPDEADISDQLEFMRKETGESSIIQWTLENDPDSIKEWCFINNDGKLDGPLAKYFEQAIRLEGTKKSYGKHAGGVVISVEPLKDICPMIKEKSSDELMCALDMKALEAIGIPKFDILGVAVLDKIVGIQTLVKEGFKIAS